MARKKKQVIKKGKEVISQISAGSGDFVKIDDGDVVDMVSLIDLDEMLSIDQHAIWLEGGNSPLFPCIGEDCPGCEAGNKPRFRAFLPVLLLDEGEQKIFSFGISIARALEELDEEFGGLAGHVFRVKRKGTGLNTTYTVIAMGKKKDVSKLEPIEIESKLGPTTRKGILQLLIETGAMEESEEWEEEKAEAEEDEEWDDV